MDSIFSKNFLKFLLYLTAHHPEEFGLIPNKDNFFKVKEIFQVLIFTKKAPHLKLNSLKSLFSFYFRDFFEFLEDFNLVRPKEYYYTPPRRADFTEIIKYNQLFTFVKPWSWYKLALDGEILFREKKPLFLHKELAENWAKVKGALLIEVNPKLLNPNWSYEIFGGSVILIEGLNYRACRGPKIDNKFIHKYLKEKPVSKKEDSQIVPFIPLKVEEEEKTEKHSF